MALLLPPSAHADTWRVGPGETLTRIAQAARVAKDGDTVEIAAGIYRGDVAVWTQDQLTIRGLGRGAVLEADGASAGDKAIWVIRGGAIRVENIEFRGARVPDLNGAGIRFERGTLHLRNTRFFDNENGILASNNPAASLHIEDSEFGAAPKHPGALHHLLYVGRIGEVVVRGSRFSGGYHAHLIKSRAMRSRIEYNLLDDGPDGEAAYELEFPDGGAAIVIGNIIAQSPRTTNSALISYAAESTHWADNSIALSHNTLVNPLPASGWFLRVWHRQGAANVSVVARNNLLVGHGRFDSSVPPPHDGNLPASLGDLADPARHDYQLRNTPRLWGHTAPAGDWSGIDLTPTRSFALPHTTLPLTPPETWQPGALQRP
ncbi:MAG: hypothetical protein KDE68_10855 [Rhodocyclaceae bacterium]|nr:hypothetical protein [Rhodocyclaceae bacterium]